MTDDEGIGRAYMRQTRHRALTASGQPSDQQRGAPQPPLTWTWPVEARRVALPPPAEATLSAPELREVIDRRTSLRRYAPTPLTLAELSFLLWATQGVRARRSAHLLRTVPSAGARHPFETFLLVNRITGLELGLYGYESLEHRLVLVRQEADLGPRLTAACLGQEMLAQSAVTFLWVAVPYRTTWRYPERGYRYLHLDAGHVCQNLYLAAEAIGAGTCAVAAFDDDALIEFLELDPQEAFVIYLAPVGRRPDNP
jgi:SagB-type dehydrogenase family enzyme